MDFKRSLKYINIGFAVCILLIQALTSSAKSEDLPPNDVARVLAGLPIAETSPLFHITKEKAWLMHSNNFDRAWLALDKRRIGSMRAWSSENITKFEPNLFYLFSGPDFLYANSFFPNASTYIFSGLESVGQVPDLRGMSSLALQRELVEIQASLNTSLNLSFFITSRMMSQLNSGKVRGILPILYVFMAREGMVIDNVSYVQLDNNGVEVSNDDKLTSTRVSGIKILFTGKGGEKKTLYYFSLDLTNRSPKKQSFLKFCSTFGKGDTLIKSASYLLHSYEFSDVRNFLVNSSSTIVQDDSGIPVRYLKSNFDLHPYGAYLGPIGLFPWGYQRDLSLIFRQSARPLTFGMGYRWQPSQSNLLLAIRSEGPSMENVPISTSETVNAADTKIATNQISSGSKLKRKPKLMSEATYDIFTKNYIYHHF